VISKVWLVPVLEQNRGRFYEVPILFAVSFLKKKLLYNSHLRKTKKEQNGSSSLHCTNNDGAKKK
jgi:hypothetical protein